eukprot:gb/GEZN01007957.1/.p1 GENE.gb/GEZN01007957.1/~~gb/GEZN01007957.1/.p1  ORF type:complete len:323 (+),score=51.07 gb/GEZN01007957.1/:30-971(+)
MSMEESDVVVKDADAPQQRCSYFRNHPSRACGLVVFLALVVVAIIYFDDVKQLFADLLQWFDTHKTEGIAVFILVYIVATVFFIPGSILTLGAGVIWGLPAILIVVVGAGLGLTLAFLVGRYLLRDWVAGFVNKYPKFSAVDRALKHEGWKLCALLRLAPLFPFNAMNYLFSITQIKFSHYVVTSVLGIIPGTSLYVWLGSLAPNISDIVNGQAGPSRSTQIAILVTTGVVIVGVFVVITVISKRALRKLIEEEERDMEEEQEEQLQEQAQRLQEDVMDESIDITDTTAKAQPHYSPPVEEDFDTSSSRVGKT